MIIESSLKIGITFDTIELFSIVAYLNGVDKHLLDGGVYDRYTNADNIVLMINHINQISNGRSVENIIELSPGNYIIILGE